MSKKRVYTLEDAAERLWGVVANASGGDWTKQNKVWQRAAARARDYYHRVIHGGGELSASEALFGFGAWLTSRKKVAGPFSAKHLIPPMVGLITEFIKANRLKDPGKFYPHNFTMPKD